MSSDKPSWVKYIEPGVDGAELVLDSIYFAVPPTSEHIVRSPKGVTITNMTVFAGFIKPKDAIMWGLKVYKTRLVEKIRVFKNR